MKIRNVAGALVACVVGLGEVAAVAEEKVIEGTLLQPPAGSLAKDTPKPDPVEVYAGPAVPLTGNWKLSPGYAKIEGNILTVEVDEKGLAESRGHAYPSARLPIDLRNYRGGIEISIRARAENVVGAKNVYTGFKFQLPYVDRTCGQPFWAEPLGCAGTFDWKTFTFRADLSDKDVESADLTVGLQEATGKAVYDLSTLTARPLRGAFTPVSAANRAHRQVYSERVKAWPQLRGVMLPPPEKVTEKDFADLRDWGATLVRFQMGCWNRDEPIWDLAHYPKFIDRMTEKLTRDIIPWARKYGIKVCVDLHDAPGKRYRSGDTVMLYNRAAADLFVETWRTIASRAKGNDDVIYGYDLVNEPKQFLPGVTDYFAIQKRAAEAIRAIDPVTPIVIESNMMDAPEQYPYLPALELPDVIYQIHMYIPGGYTHQGLGSAHSSLRPKYPDPERGWDREYLKRALRYVHEFAERHGARIFVGEFSAMCYAEGADKYLEDCISIFNEYGWDWAYHAFREWEGWSVEHTTKDGIKEAKNFIPSPDNPRRRALIRGLKGE